MTKLRALYGALACGAVSLSIGVPAHATLANYVIDNGSSQSDVGNACVGALPGATGEDCTYNQSNPANAPGDWIGPILSSNYYRDGDSPFQKNPGASPLPEPTTPDPDTAALAITGTLIIDDQNNGTCDNDDTISGSFELEAGTRTFSGGPGTWAEETWGAGTVIFSLPASVPNSQVAVPAGCEYIFGDKGFPPFPQTLGLSPAGVLTYPVDVEIGAAPINPGDGDQDAWDTATIQAIGVGTFEAADFDGNHGVAVSLDNAAFTGGTYQCLDNFGDPASPVVTTPEGCNDAAADGTPCEATGSHFCGGRRDMENWLIRIVVNPSGDIVEGTIFAHNESIIFQVPPAPGANNSWDGPVLQFTATCQDCSVAKDDNYTFVTGTTNPAPLAIGANDDPSGELNDATTTVAIDAPGPTAGTCALTGPQPGAVQDIGCDYTANDFNNPFTDSFSYTIDDGVTDPVLGLQATVSIDVEDDTAPAANAYTIDFDSQGVDPASLRNTTDVLTGVAGNAGGNNPAVSDDGTAQSGTVTVSGAEVTYAANADFFQGTDTFNYTIDDDNFGSPGVTPESASAQVTVNIPNVMPTTSDGTTTVEAGNSVDFTAIIGLGNGTMDQHTVDGGCDNGTVTIAGLSVDGADVLVTGTYDAPADFDGDATCTYTVTDEDGAGDAVDGVVVITVTESGIVVKLPGAGSALGPWSLALLLLIPLLRSRRARRGFWS